jgi:hypothetical protein
MVAARLLLVAAAMAGCAHPLSGAEDDLAMGGGGHHDGFNGGGGDGGVHDMNPGSCAGKNLMTDPMNCGFCGHVCQLPHVAMNACVNGTCTIGTCAMGFYDVNMAPTDGCECQQAATVTSATMQCNGAAQAGQVTSAMASKIDLTGNIVPNNVSTWYQIVSVNAPVADGNNNNYDIKIGFTNNPMKQFRFDLLYDDCTTEASCGANEAPTGLTDYDFSACGAPNEGECPCNNGATAPGVHQCKDHSTTLRMRVYRQMGMPVTCDNYTIEITNGM